MWSSSLRRASESFGTWAGQDTQIGALLYVSVICYNIFFVLSVPSESLGATTEYHGTTHAFVALEEDLELHNDTNQERSLAQLSDVSKCFHQTMPPSDSVPFCLETACYLMECTWQTYFPPVGVSMYSDKDILPSLIGTAVQANRDTERLGLHWSKSFHNRHTDSWGYVASNTSGRIVIAFRGTVGLLNVSTDLRLSQIPLPDMRQNEISLNKILERSKHYILKYRWQLMDADLEHNYDGKNVSLNDEKKPTLIRNLSSTSNDEKRRLSQPSRHSYGAVEVEMKHLETPNKNRNYLHTASSSLNPFDDPEVEDSPPPSSSQHCCRTITSFMLSVVSALPFCRQVLPRVHEGFWDAYCSVREEMLCALMIAIREQYYFIQDYKYPIQICLCGHSLGGALAALAALEVSLNLHDIISIAIPHLVDIKLPTVQLYTYGTPRVGNTYFASMLNSCIKNYYRLEVDGDIFTRMPKLLGLYRHAGKLVLIDSEKSGCFIVQPSIVELQLFRHGTQNTTCHHLCHYRDCLEACFEDNELAQYISKEYEATRISSSVDTMKSNVNSKISVIPEWLLGSR